jgi:hypothetical protein
MKGNTITYYEHRESTYQTHPSVIDTSYCISAYAQITFFAVHGPIGSGVGHPLGFRCSAFCGRDWLDGQESDSAWLFLCGRVSNSSEINRQPGYENNRLYGPWITEANPCNLAPASRANRTETMRFHQTRTKHRSTLVSPAKADAAGKLQN